MKMGLPRFEAALVSLFVIMLAGCGGGGGGTQSAVTPVIPPALATPTPAAGAPVGYLQSAGGLTTSGTIISGAHSALVAIMSGDSAASSFASDALSVSTGATVQGVALMPSSRSVAPPRLAPIEAFPADDRALLERMQTLRVADTGPATRHAQSVLPSTLTVGTGAPLWVQKGSLGGSRVNVQVPATLLAQSAHTNIWIDNTLQLPQSSISQIVADAENAYASDTAHFASADYASSSPGLQARYSACAPGGGSQGTTAAYISEPADRRIDVMVVNASNLGGVGGYFSAANLMTQATLNCLNGSSTTYESNEAPFIFVGWFAGSGSTYELQEDLVRSTAHELQHLINFVNHGILAAAASSASFNGNETPYINEGLSMLAQDFAVQTMYGSGGVQFDADDAVARANVYLAAPSNYSLSAFTGIDPSAWGGSGGAQYNCAGGCYGAAYLFERYLHDRFGGDGYTHSMETSGMTGDANLQAATGEGTASLFGDFALAMAADTLGVPSVDTRFNFGSLRLSGSYVDQFGATTKLAGLYAQPFSGNAMNVSAPVGGFAFVAMSTVPSGGTSVSVSDHASAPGFSLEGGLAQK